MFYFGYAKSVPFRHAPLTNLMLYAIINLKNIYDPQLGFDSVYLFYTKNIPSAGVKGTDKYG